MYSAQPTLKTLVQGWYIHPYGGPPPVPTTDNQGIAGVPVIRNTILSGADNILIGEIGFTDPTVNSGEHWLVDSPSAAFSTAQAQQWMAELLQTAVTYNVAGWLKALLIYNRNDGAWAMNLSGGALTPQGTVLANFPQPVQSVPPGSDNIPAPSPGSSLWVPGDEGLAVCTVNDPAAAVSSFQPTAGAIYFYRVRLDEWYSFSYLRAPVYTAGAGLTANENLMGVYDIFGNRLGETGSLVSDWESATTSWYFYLRGRGWLAYARGGLLLDRAARQRHDRPLLLHPR
jgi:hypothetical protein